MDKDELWKHRLILFVTSFWGILYLLLEPQLFLQLITLVFLLFLLFSNWRQSVERPLLLFSLYIISLSALYLFHFSRLSYLDIVALASFSVFIVLLSFPIHPKVSFNLQILYSCIFVLEISVLRQWNFNIGLPLQAILVSTSTASLLEAPLYSQFRTWSIVRVYAILSLLISLILGFSLLFLK